MRAAGFIAIDRGIFDHPALRKPERFLAWQWLIAQAAWKAEGRRGPWGVVHVERGEIATSTHDLARAWRWPQSNVRCFLARLERDGMIAVQKTRSATRSVTGPQLPHAISIISICNYDKFQDASTGPKTKPAQQPAQQPAQGTLQGIVETGGISALTTKPSNQIEERKGLGGVGEEEKRAAPSAPRHGAQSKKHGTIYFLRGTEEWRIHCDDYKETIGAEPLPDRWGGFWFYYLGEAARPAHQRTWRRQDAFGAAKYGGRRA